MMFRSVCSRICYFSTFPVVTILVFGLASAISQCHNVTAAQLPISEPNGTGSTPQILGFTAELYGGYIMVKGRVVDADSNPNGWPVTIWGAVSGTAYVRPDGTFTAYFPSATPYGEVHGITSDNQGNLSNLATTEIY